MGNLLNPFFVNKIMKEEEFMRSAIADAKKNKHHFGAIIVKD